MSPADLPPLARPRLGVGLATSRPYNFDDINRDFFTNFVISSFLVVHNVERN